ncbi:MAG TPA: amino acid ABC transporter permease [Solirubrobacterales bacterium]|jgi:polar amino acid transport system permease protein|nr:amino acid ABC transporter permease [Solirubrobacterales bacterium]HMU27299.1 amino acid ABC transporter permease [Solirubrobacterales bacterium]HMX71316.1 amino acid ABC transporter permease [Solirubrobacterales bacterium]HMY26002.1 amino acid ABC transporter permease [Solirubrobacterales bacterium]HNA24704.1 amino acid ABC transporter permease [Solirubrobacterales bacterium]
MGEFFQTYFDFSIMGDNFNAVLEGFWWTIKLSLIGGAFALAWGLILSVIRQLPGKALAPVRWLAIAYIDCLRGIPMLLTLLLIYGGLGTLQSTGTIPEWLGIPEFFGWPSSFWYGVMALTLTYGAYMAEVYRAGIESIPRGQMEAARSLGMSHGQAMRFVIVPQAIRRVIPPLLNDYIALMKDTSLVSVISLAEVVHVGQDVYSTTFNPSALTLGAIMFLIVTLPLARLVDWQIKRQDEKFQRGLA